MKKIMFILSVLFLASFVSAVCNDTDGGINYFERGVIFNGNTSQTDSCYSGETYDNYLYEYYCNNGTVELDFHNCADDGMVCQAGQCMFENETNNCVEPFDGFYITRNTTLCQGNYHLTDEDLNGIMLFARDDVTLDCNHAEIVGDNDGRGIFLNGANNVQILNCRFMNYSTAMFLFNAEKLKVINSEVFGSNPYQNGIYLNNIRNSDIESNYENGFGIGISLYNSHNNYFRYNNAAGNSVGVRLIDSTENQFEDNLVQYNNHGFYLQTNSQRNTFWKNRAMFNQIQSAFETEDSTDNSWNLSTEGNCWTDFRDNIGFPYYYKIFGSGGGIDFWPCGKIQGLQFWQLGGIRNTTRTAHKIL